MAFSGIARALSNRSYRLYASGSAISLVGFWLQKVAVGWLTWELTGSSTWLGVVAIADAVPATILAPITGVLADRVERIRLIRLTQFAQVVQAGALATLSIAGRLHIETLLCLVVVLGFIQAFAQPVRLSLVPSLVRVEDMSSAVALNSSLFNLARFIGPVIAGFLISIHGVGAAFAAATVCFAVFLGVMFRIEPLRNEVTPNQKGSIRSAVVEGFRYVIAHEGIRPILLLVIATTLFSRSFFDLLPAFADQVFERGAQGLSILVAAVGAGALGSSLWLAGRGHTAGLTRIGVSLLFVVAAGEAIFATTHRFSIAVACMAVIGFASVATNITCQTLLQNTVAGQVRGRVMSLYGVLMRAGPAFGALALGAISDRVGLRWAVVGAAVCCALAWAWARRRMAGWARVLERRPT